MSKSPKEMYAVHWMRQYLPLFQNTGVNDDSCYQCHLSLSPWGY